MNTFLPFPDFDKCAASLDKRRCFKQLVESYQILNTITGKSKGWIHHPVINMWKDYPDCLQWYYNRFYDYCVEVHKVNIVKLPKPAILPKYMNRPKWLGYPLLHRAYCSNLLRKALEDCSKGRLELSKRLAEQNIYITVNGGYDLTQDYVWPVDKSGHLIEKIEQWIMENKR